MTEIETGITAVIESEKENETEIERKTESVTATATGTETQTGIGIATGERRRIATGNRARSEKVVVCRLARLRRLLPTRMTAVSPRVLTLPGGEKTKHWGSAGGRLRMM